MKSKRKLDAKAIKQFFIDHTEKIAIGVVGLLFLYFTYSAVMLQANDSYKKEPKNLAEAVQAAQTTMVAGPKLETPVTEAPIPPYAKHIERFKEPEDASKYSITEPIYPVTIAQRNPRGTPLVIPVEELRAVAGRGALNGRDSGAGTVGQRWVSITGLVPYAKQLAEYKSKFESASLQAGHDVPDYGGFLVQRAEVTPGAAGEPNWDKAVTICDSEFLTHQLDKWSGTAPDVVEIRYISPSLASPLPVRAIGEWGDEVAHPSEIKVMPKEERDQMQGGGQGGQFPAVPPNRRGEGHGQQMPPRMRGEGGFIRNPRGPAPLEGRGGAPGGLFHRPPAGAKEDAAQNKIADEAQVPPYYLLRYFDFDVEPGKQYAYRVFPVLWNPNSYEDVPENTLLEPQQHNQQFLNFNPGKDQQPDANNKFNNLRIDVPWSNVCQTARLPGDLRLTAGTVETAKSPSPTEITGEVHFLRWDQTSGANTNASQGGLYRGTVLNFENMNVITPGQQSPTQEKMESNYILADITGGEALPAKERDKPHAYGAMLFLDDAGNLVISDEASQAKEWIAETKEPERPTTDVGRRGFQNPERGRFPRGRGERGGPRAPGGGSDSSLPDMAPSGGR